MARANPESSFEASARHLFRHLNDAAALRVNPLCRALLVDSRVEATLEKVHARVAALAELVCGELDREGLRLQAHRRREIVAALCAGEAADETASRLELSRSQYYRERQAIATAVARALRQATPTHDARFIVRDDPLRLLFKRAVSLRDAGLAGAALGILEEAHGGAGDDFAKSAIGLALAEELVFLGRHERARELLDPSLELSVSPAGSGAGEWLRDHVALYEARLRTQLSRDPQSGDALARFAKRRLGERRTDDVTFDAVFLAGEGYRNTGRYREARAMLSHLRAMDQRSAQGGPKRRIAMSLLAAYCAEGSPDELAVAEDSMREALESAIASGSLIASLLAIAGLVSVDAAGGRDESAYLMAHEALRMARGADFHGFLGYVAAEIAEAMLKTRYWRATNPLIFEAESLTSPGTLAQARLKHAQGVYLARSGRYHQAREALSDGFTLARNLGNRKVEALILRDRALMLRDAPGARERGEVMREAVALAECYGSADDLCATYDAAARIVGDRRSLRLARQTRPAPSFSKPVTMRPLTLQ